MQVEQFYQSRKADWDELAELTRRAERGVERLSPQQVRRLSRLYRAVTSDLALAQRDFTRHRLTAHLNQLVARAHAVIYQGEVLIWARIGRFFNRRLPRTFRRSWTFLIAAAALFFVPALLAGITTALQPNASELLLSGQVQQLHEQIAQQELWTDIPIEMRPYAASFIMRNNIQVAILAFGGGMLAGLLTVWILVFNGLMLGGITGLTAHYGVGFELWTFVIGHGVIELSVIVIAGGAGLMLGWSILQPGMLRRRDALTTAAREAIVLAVGCIPLLLIAGTIEGFISPAEGLPWWLKWSVGLLSGTGMYAYLLLAGRETDS